MRYFLFSFFITILFIYSASFCMDHVQRPQGNGSIQGASDTSSEPLALYQQAPVHYTPPPSSGALLNVLQQRIPNNQPLLDPVKRVENMALIKSIGSYNNQTKLFSLIGLALFVNGMKDTIIASKWGVQPQFPSTDLIPPSHLLPLRPCQQLCYAAGCCGIPNCSGECIPVCGDKWDCSNTRAPFINTLGNTAGVSAAVNFFAALGAWMLAAHSSLKQGKADQKLEQILQAVDEATQGQPCINSPSWSRSNSGTHIHSVLNEVQQKYTEGQDPEVYIRKRQELIDLIKSSGSSDAGIKMYLLLAAIFGVNLAKDMIIGTVWGQEHDTKHTPASAILANHSAPIGLCKVACWRTGCCAQYCPQPIDPCTITCEPQCVDTKMVANAVGCTSAASGIVNIVCFAASLIGAFSRWHEGNTTEKRITQLLGQLDRVAAQEEQE